jgi:hypothetical protein
MRSSAGPGRRQARRGQLALSDYVNACRVPWDTDVKGFGRPSDAKHYVLKMQLVGASVGSRSGVADRLGAVIATLSYPGMSGYTA